MGPRSGSSRNQFAKAQLTCLLCVIAFLVSALSAQAFVLMGQPNANEVAAWNYTDDLGAPKSIDRQFKRFYRWTLPHFVYSFDASFVNYFGSEGMAAVDDAMGVINDFFVNDDYQGMSELDLARHGFAGNYNTSWVNTTAQNAQIIDIKSIVLGMMVNHLGLGNPHRHAYSITGITTNASTNALNINVALRNYDPTTAQATDVINGVQYSYRMVHDSQLQVGATPPTFGIADMEEFTTDTTGNAWSSTAAIVDAFYGNTQLFWTDTPSLFNFGVYYDGYNAMGGQFEPRHALTYDDAGGLKYLYSKNNISYDGLPRDTFVVEDPSYVPDSLKPIYDPNVVNGRNRHAFWPRRGAGAFPAAAPTGNPYRGYFLPGWNWALGVGAVGIPPGWASVPSEGIDAIHLHHQPFDSLLGTTFTPTNFTWKYNAIWPSPASNKVTWISDAQGRKIGTMTAEKPGIQWLAPNPDLKGVTFWSDPVSEAEPFTQVMGRLVSEPDILFVADNLPSSADGVPIGFGRDVPVSVTTNAVASLPGVGATNEVGPGTFDVPAVGSATAGGMLAGAVNAKFAFVFNKIGGHLEDFEVIWSGETSVVGNIDELSSHCSDT